MSGTTISPLQTYLADKANETKLAAAASQANAQQNNLITHFQANAAGIKSPASLMKDYKALSLVLGAFGLGNLINATALVKQLMTQDPEDNQSVAHRTGNAKYIAFAKAMSVWNPPPFATAASRAAIITSFQKNAFEAAADTQTPGMQKALYFTRTAGSIKSLTQLQSDADLLAVAVTGVGVPYAAFVNLSFEKQTALLKQKINIADLQKPKYVTHLAEMYLVQQQLSASTTHATPTVHPGSLVSLFSPYAQSDGNGVLTILLQQESASSGNTASLLGSNTGSSNLLSLFA